MTASRTASFGKRGPAPPSVVSGRAAVPAPRTSDEPAARPQAVSPPGFFARLFSRIPWFTLVLSYLLVTRFNAELARATDWAGPKAPGYFSLLAMGASSRTQVEGHGEWWRLFTQTALHGSLSHLVGNLLTFIVVGFLLEPMIGIGWFAAIYFTGGFAGAVLSTFLNPADVMSVGASGAIMAMLAALFTLSFHAGAPRPVKMRRVAAFSLFPALIPTVTHGGAVTDINAHLGGCMAGALIGFVMLVFWNEEDEHPPGRSIAAIIAGLWAAMTVWAFMASTATYVHYAKDGLNFIPPRELPADTETMKNTSFALVTKYPRDPRAHMFRGLYFLDQNDVSDAEPYFRNAQRLGEGSPVMSLSFSNWTRALLAVSVRYQGRKEEAMAIAAPLCADTELDERSQKTLRITELCR
jgi:rhomboid protease GluP